MKRFNYFLLDVFTDQLFGGNQLAIFPEAGYIPPELYQKIAKELNLAETVFLFGTDLSHPVPMRIFTPGKELPTAGHPTIGTAFYLTRESDSPPSIILKQKAGNIKVEIQYRDGQPDLLTMFQPLPVFGPVHKFHSEVAEMLSLAANDLADFPIQEVSCGNNILLVPVKDVETLGKIKYRVDVWERIKETIHEAIVYCFTLNGVENADVRGRMFAAQMGIPEDPATGSANGPLICYLVNHQLIQPPVVSLQGYEMGRPSQLYLDVSVNKDNEIQEVRVSGRCVYVGKGELFLDA